MATRPFPVALTFDVDAEALWLNRDPANAQRPVTMSLGRYGPNVGVPKILRLLKRRGIAATFFVPGWVAERHPDAIRSILAEGHEIAHHGYLHEWVTRLTPAEEEAVLILGLEAIQRVTGHRPIGYRAPAWQLTDRSYDLLAKHDFRYSANMMDADGPYVVTTGDGKRLAELPVSWALDDSSLYLYDLQLPNPKLTPNEDVLSLWCGEFDGLYEDGTACVHTMHPQLTGRSYRLKALDAFIDHIVARGGVEFVRCGDLAARYLGDSA
jgi:peptidoglycan/xylan/chitin deacetylase (PgdA/CDA1 family)